MDYRNKVPPSSDTEAVRIKSVENVNIYHFNRFRVANYCISIDFTMVFLNISVNFIRQTQKRHLARERKNNKTK